MAKRFAGYGWKVIKVQDVNDLGALRRALRTFRRTADQPTLIIVRSVIAYGAPNKHNTHGAHGAPLGEEEIRLAKAAYGWPQDAAFPRARGGPETLPVGHRPAWEEASQGVGNEVRRVPASSIPSWPRRST